MKTLVSAAVFAALSSSVVAETVIYIGGTEYGINEIANNTDTLTFNDLESINAKDIGEALRGTSSVEVTSNGGPGQLTSVFFRGTESDHTLFLMNGVNINDGITNNASLQFINPLMADELTIVKGSSSTLFGSAIGGVVSIDTKQITPEKLKGVAKVSYGSNNYKEVLTKKAFRESDHAISIGFSAIDTDGIKSTQFSTHKSGYENQSMDLAFHKNLSLGKLKTSLTHTQGRGEYDANSSQLYRDFETTIATVEVDDIKHDLGKLNLHLSRFRQATDESDSDFARTYRSSLKIKNKLDFDSKNTLLTGVDFHNESIRNQDGSGGFNSKEAYAQLSQTNIDSHWSLGARVIDDEFAGTHKTWNAAYTKLVNENLSLGAMSSTGFKTPTGNDRFLSGSNDAKPETSRTNELTATFKPNNETKLTASIFQTRIEHMIVWVNNGANWVLQNSDSGVSKIDGQELSLSKDFINWKFKGTILFQDPRGPDGTQLLKRAKRTANLSAVYKNDTIKWSTQISHSDKRTDAGLDYDEDWVEDSDYVMSTYTVVNTNLDYALTDNLSLNGKIDNVFDTNYETTDGYSTFGQSFYIGLKYTGF
jgi:vitamin B12 transporter